MCRGGCADSKSVVEDELAESVRGAVKWMEVVGVSGPGEFAGDESDEEPSCERSRRSLSGGRLRGQGTKDLRRVLAGLVAVNEPVA